jgi:hypothetical protein
MKPYQLDPTRVDEPTTKMEAMSKKFGATRAAEIKDMFKGRFEALGYQP